MFPGCGDIWYLDSVYVGDFLKRFSFVSPYLKVSVKKSQKRKDRIVFFPSLHR